MVDPTLRHLLFLTPFALAVYYVLPRRAQNIWLLIVSYLFYADLHLAFPFALIAMTGANFLLARQIRRTGRRSWLVAGIAFNVLVLVGAKYAAGWINDARGMAGLAALPGLSAILLPVGLSFRMLEMISYLIDVANGRVDPSARFVDFALYAAYFPKLIAGPIERARSFLPKLAAPRTVTNDTVARAFTLILTGAVRKLALADPLRMMTPPDLFTDPARFSGPQLVLWLIAFSFVLYNDFAGYTSMMRGISVLFGIELSPNFDAPYFARNITEFWNRWHMSFSFWLRDYIFFPVSRALAGRIPDRSRLAHVIVPPLVTMTVSALWHAAAPAMLVWGLLHALYMIGWRIPSLGRAAAPPNKQPLWRQTLGALLNFTLVTLAWVPFAMPLPVARVYWSGLLRWSGPVVLDERVIGIAALTLILDWIQHHKGEVTFVQWPLLARAGVTALALVLLMLALAAAYYDSTPFVYQGF